MSDATASRAQVDDVGNGHQEIAQKVRSVTFVSHSSKDRAFVKKLVDAMLRYGIDAWWDAYEIRPGDSIRRKINEGLRSSTYGVVVLSHNYYEKGPSTELGALHATLNGGQIIPLYYKITPREVANYDPLMADIHGIEVPDGDVRPVVALLAAKILGSGRWEDGRLVFRHQTLSVSSVPLSVDDCIEDVLFEDCVIQGNAVLTIHAEVTFPGVVLRGPHNVQIVSESVAATGTLGVRRTEFRNSRFKNVGLVMTPDQWAVSGLTVAPDGYHWPEHLQ